MKHIPNAARHLGADGWHKPWSGHNGGSCVEIKSLADGRFALRQSEEPDGPALLFTETELDVFAHGWAPHKTVVRAS
ncbi:DUF397 domain-containing protein [Nonomuraea sp. NPDC050404]|uniref:DUF397 domain-containing protein n=1 Tax=Nonomuraea sp. NPDC050404 TaxID=3155783 RepID=UPI0033C86694